MEQSFWQQKWADNEIGFHQASVNPLLTTYFSKLNVPLKSRIFVPLCGKSHDISWLLSQGYSVVGVELVELAVQQLFQEMAVEPSIETVGSLKHYHVDQLDIWTGDFFDLSAETIGEVDAVYDRAALIALPLSLRRRYSKHLMAITGKAPQLLITLEYDQSQMDGPPFSVDSKEISGHYGTDYDLELLSTMDADVKGRVMAKENVWLIQGQ